MSALLEVYGHLWNGARATYTYKVGSARAQILKNMDQPTTLDMGDFASVLDWRLTETTTVTERRGSVVRHISTTKTLRGFRNGMTPTRFAALNEAA